MLIWESSDYPEPRRAMPRTPAVDPEHPCDDCGRPGPHQRNAHGFYLCSDCRPSKADHCRIVTIWTGKQARSGKQARA